jgi:hypothetical protein
MKLFLVITALLAIVLSGCGGQATPTVSSSQLQSAAAAATGTTLALTQAANPTGTLQPSPTPLPSPTLTSLPTSVVSSPTATASSSSGNQCNLPLGSNPAGPKANVMLQNHSSGKATITIFVKMTKFGECGYRAYVLAKGASTFISDLPLGCYAAAAWIGSGPNSAHSYGGGCWNNLDRIYFEVTDKVIHFTSVHH